MDGNRFDDFARTLAGRPTRRRVVKALAGGIGGGVLALVGRATEASKGTGGGTPQGRCPAGYTNCRGKCVILEADENNCGACAVVCPAGWDCCHGACTAPDGFQSDVNNCGACNVACGPGERCCGGTCTDVQSDETNCGACGVVCEDIDSGGACCAGSCVNLERDNDNCTACGKVCPPGEFCDFGCFCEAGSCPTDAFCNDSFHCEHCHAAGGTCLTEGGMFVCCGGLPCVANFCRDRCTTGADCPSGRCCLFDPFHPDLGSYCSFSATTCDG